MDTGGNMFNLRVKGSQRILDHQIPIVEGGFGENKRVITAKTAAELHKMTIGDINKLINNNLKILDQDVDFIDIVEMIRSNGDLREGLNLTLRDVNKTTKHFYILSEPGYIKLVVAMRNDNETKWEVMSNFINGYFRMRSNLDKIAGKYLTTNEINQILKLADKNEYIKEYTKILVPPRGNKGKTFKAKEIIPFTGKIQKEVEEYLISSLGVPDLNHIPGIAYKGACTLVEEFYTLSEDLKNEFNSVFKNLLNLRTEVIAENQAKNVEKRKLLQEEFDMLRQVIKGYLK